MFGLWSDPKLKIPGLTSLLAVTLASVTSCLAIFFDGKQSCSGSSPAHIPDQVPPHFCMFRCHMLGSCMVSCVELGTLCPKLS